MTQEEKELLLKDLSARLPYGVKCHNSKYRTDLAEEIICCHTNYNHNCVQLGSYLYKLEDIKPYLFPLSSMTEEQKKYISDRWGVNEDFDFEIDPNWGKNFVDLGDVVDYVNWLNENHFDYRGLIEKGLALDATGLNIYKIKHNYGK